jgi:hypothetical protein
MAAMEKISINSRLGLLITRPFSTSDVCTHIQYLIQMPHYKLFGNDLVAQKNRFPFHVCCRLSAGCLKTRRTLYFAVCWERRRLAGREVARNRSLNICKQMSPILRIHSMFVLLCRRDGGAPSKPQNTFASPLFAVFPQF